MDYQAYSTCLLHEWQLCATAKPKNDAVSVQLDKDRCEEWAIQLMTTSMWGSANELAEACHQFEYRLKNLKEKLIIEILKNGSV